MSENSQGDPRAEPPRDQSTNDGTGHRPSRRRFLATTASLGLGAAAGCSGADSSGMTDSTATATDTTSTDGGTEAGNAGDDGGAPTLRQVEDPPEAVYVPTHFEGVRRLEPVRAGPYELLPMVTYPHRFWTVTGETLEETTPSGTGVHLMVAVRDPETGMRLPAETGLELTVAREGESGSTHAPWPMLSQEMGFHLGDNVPLGADGTYEVSVRVGSVDARRTGAFAGRFDEPGRASFTFAFDDAFREAVVGDVTYLPEDDWGRRGALAPMAASMTEGDDESGTADHEDGMHPHLDVDAWAGSVRDRRYGTYRRASDVTALPPATELPGTVQGAPTSGDAVFATTVLAAGSRFVDGDELYLAVSPRTPYNRSMLPMLGLSYEVARDGEVVASGPLASTLDPELGYHYGTALPSVADGDTLTIAVETIPQAARHAGYQTAFREMPPVSMELRAP